MHQYEFDPILILFFLQDTHHFLVDRRAAVHDLVHVAGIDHIPERALDETGDNRIRIQHFELVAHRVNHPIRVEKRDIHGHVIGGHCRELLDPSRTFDDDHDNDRIHEGDLSMPSGLVNINELPASQVQAPFVGADLIDRRPRQ